MRVQPVEPSHYDVVVELWKLAGLTRPWNDARLDLTRAVDGPGSLVLVGVDEGRVIASVMVGHDGHRGWVYYLAVHPNRQGQGHGRTMMAAAEAWLRQQRIPKLNLMVRSENEQAHGFYRALGFGRDDVVVFSRRLDAEAVAAGVMIKAGCVLLGLRAKTRRYGGSWALPGGHLEGGESSSEAVVRELAEEVGVRASARDIVPLASTMIGSAERSVWLIPRWEGDVQNLAPDEHDSLRWFKHDELTRVPLAHPGDLPILERLLEH